MDKPRNTISPAAWIGMVIASAIIGLLMSATGGTTIGSPESDTPENCLLLKTRHEYLCSNDQGSSWLQPVP